MKNSDNPPYQRGTTRRSFMKKSVVAAVAVSNLTMFTGLADASSASPPMMKVCTDFVIGAGGCTRNAQTPLISHCTVHCTGFGTLGIYSAICFESQDSGETDGEYDKVYCDTASNPGL